MLVQVRLAIENDRATSKQHPGHAEQAPLAAAAHATMGQAPAAELPATSAPNPCEAACCGHVQQQQASSSMAGAQDAAVAAAEPGLGSFTAQAAAAAAVAAAAAEEEADEESSGSLDIRDLSWVDRERVLRLLFAKINGKAAERRAAVLPPHSFQAAVESAVPAAQG